VRLKLKGSAEKKGGGRIGAPQMGKGARVMRGCSPEERRTGEGSGGEMDGEMRMRFGW
jgi:hypothetical protein